MSLWCCTTCRCFIRLQRPSVQRHGTAANNNERADRGAERKQQVPRRARLGVSARPSLAATQARPPAAAAPWRRLQAHGGSWHLHDEQGGVGYRGGANAARSCAAPCLCVSAHKAAARQAGSAADVARRCRRLGCECAACTLPADPGVGCKRGGSTIALSVPTTAIMRRGKGGGEVAPAGQQRLAPPASALGLALKGWMGLGKHRGGSRAREAAGRCGAASQVGSF